MLHEAASVVLGYIKYWSKHSERLMADLASHEYALQSIQQLI